MPSVTLPASPAAPVLPAAVGQTSDAMRTVGKLLDDLRASRDRKDKLNEALKAESAIEKAIQGKLLDWHEQTELLSATNAVIGVYFKPNTLYAVVDPEKWNDLFRWAVETDNTHIFKREVVSTRVEELLDQGVKFPAGLTMESFTNINIRRMPGAKK